MTNLDIFDWTLIISAALFLLGVLLAVFWPDKPIRHDKIIGDAIERAKKERVDRG